MDTSKQYIEMCDCEEIQEQKHAPPLEIQQCVVMYGTTGRALYYYNDYFVEMGEVFIWLPRQDQLQALVDNDFNGFVWYVDGCYGIGVDEFSVDNEELPSMEQLWLKFVMGEKYDKFWDDVWVDRV